MNILIEAGPVVMEATLHDSPTGRALFEALPLETQAQTWGDEIYFGVPVVRRLDETAVDTVSSGDLGYWPTGKAFCIFFGPTPISGPGEIRPASAVNLVGRIQGQPEVFQKVKPGDTVRLSPR